MKNVIVRLSSLKGEIRDEVMAMLEETDPDMISFPYGGKMVQGFIFKWEDTSYLIIQSEVATGSYVEDDDDDDDDDSEDGEDVGMIDDLEGSDDDDDDDDEDDDDADEADDDDDDED